MSDPVKMLLLGESGAGKTCALASLVRSGYHVRVIDLDNGTMPLRALASEAPAGSLSVVPLTEKMRAVKGRIIPVSASVWTRATDLLSHWKTPEGLDLGPVDKWDEQCVLAIDSLSVLGTAAMNHHLAMNGALGAIRTGYDYTRDIGAAQSYIKSLIELLYDSSIRANIVIITHLSWSKADGTMPSEEEKKQKPPPVLLGFPNVIGKAIGPTIPRYFCDVMLAKRDELTGKRLLVTSGEPRVGLKSSNPLKAKRSYPQENGLAEYFSDLRGASTMGAGAGSAP